MRMFTIIAVMLTGSLLSTAQPFTTLRVPGQYKTIQAAVNAAQSHDLVLVSPGVYRETVDTTRANRIGVKLVSTDGPLVTIIDGGGKGPVVTLQDGPLEGFTVTNGSTPYNGGGILVTHRSSWPSGWVKGCIITGNQAAMGGGGFHGSANLINNVITRNHTSGNGGGAHLLDRNKEVVGNVIHDNTAGMNGGGLFLQTCSTSLILENSVFHNACTGTGGGIHIENQSTIPVVNTILWNNKAGKAGLEMYAATGSMTTLRHCVVKGGKAGVAFDGTSIVILGPGILDADPLFVDPAGGDCHLRARSPCFQAGDTSFNRPYRLDFTDFEGDPRIALDAIDIGVDEFHPHLYVTGDATPGKDIDVKAVGPPGVDVVWGLSLHPAPLANPVILPGLGGLYLQPPLVLVPLGRTNRDGLAVLQVRIPPTLPVPRLFPGQALIGYGLSNLERISVQ